MRRISEKMQYNHRMKADRASAIASALPLMRNVTERKIKINMLKIKAWEKIIVLKK